MFLNPFYFSRKGLYNGIKEYSVNLKGKLLDFGCGSKPYRNLFACDEYVGVDLESSGHNHEKEDIDFYYNGKSLPFDDNTFDSIFTSEVFEHIFNLKEILNELKRVLKPGGKILITVPLTWDEHEAPFDFGRYTTFGIKHILEESGFEILKQSKLVNNVETIFQLWNLYIYRIFETKKKYLNLFLHSLFIPPFTSTGAVLSYIFPRKFDLYTINIILAGKK